MLESFVKGLKSLVMGRGDPTLSPEEKRNLIRVRCRLPVSVQEEGEASPRPGIVTDISLNGMRVKLNSAPRSKALLVSHPLQGSEFEVETVRTEVMWTRERRMSGEMVAGLRFAEEPENLARSWVRYILRAIGLDERAIYQRRKFIRADSLLPADLHDLATGERLADGNAINLGMGGMLFETLDQLVPDTPVRITVGPLSGLKPLDLPGVVLGTVENPDQKFFHYSVRFTTPGPGQVETLGKFVVALLKQNSGLYGRQHG